MQDTWQYQGRQRHGEFGHGTAPHDDEPLRRQQGRTNPPAPADIATHAAYVAHGVIGHLPRTDARDYERGLANGMLVDFQKVVADHPGLSHLDDATYRDRVLGNALTEGETRNLRQAADLTHGARTLDDLAPATAGLAGVVGSAGVRGFGLALKSGAVNASASSARNEDGTTGSTEDLLNGKKLAAIGDLPCDGLSYGCSGGGTWDTTAMYHVYGRNLCRSCAVKALGLDGEPASEQIESLERFRLKSP